jgi:hypothetical protein
MCHFFNKEKDLFIRSVFAEGDQMDLVIVTYAQVGLNTQSCIVVMDLLLLYGCFVGPKEHCASCLLDELKDVFLKFLINPIGAAKTQGDREFRPYDQGSSFLKSCI